MNDLTLFDDERSEPPERFTAQIVVSTLTDTMAANGVPVTSRTKGMIARQAKELLDDGFEVELVLVAAVISVRRGVPAHMHFIAQDLAVARAGQRISRQGYEAELNRMIRRPLDDVIERVRRKR
jgi:hypothetical protein